MSEPTITPGTGVSTGGQLRTLAVRITEDLRAQLDIIAQLTGRSTTEEIRLALEHWIDKTKSDPEVLRADMTSSVAHAASEPVRTAVIYLRVSTKEQAERGGQAEGFSIPAQRQALQRKAEALGAVIVSEFVDAGESARSADRPDLQRMLTYIQQNRVDYVLVHKLDRLARNRVDDVGITVAIRDAGAVLVSATENIDETPSGALMHGIMSSIAEFYSRNLAQEVVKGLTQKVANGGTVSRAPIGYQNVRKYVDGVEIRTVEIDEERADLIRWAFTSYTTGEWSLRRLADALEERGLTYRQTAKQVERPIRANKLHYVLRNRYYLGYVTWRGVEHEGAHPAIVDQATFDRVQAVLDSHAVEGARQRRHMHYLNGSVHCARCGSRLLYMLVTGNGGQYEYFVCSGRHTSRTDCDLPYLPLDKVEEAVLGAWRGEQATWQAEGLPQIEHGLIDQLRAVQAEANKENKAATSSRSTRSSASVSSGPRRPWRASCRPTSPVISSNSSPASSPRSKIEAVRSPRAQRAKRRSSGARSPSSPTAPPHTPTADRSCGGSTTRPGLPRSSSMPSTRISAPAPSTPTSSRHFT